MTPHRWMAHERCPHCGAREYEECKKPARCILDDPRLAELYKRVEDGMHSVLGAAPAAIAALKGALEREQIRERNTGRWLKVAALALVAAALFCIFWPWL